MKSKIDDLAQEVSNKVIENLDILYLAFRNGFIETLKINLLHPELKEIIAKDIRHSFSQFKLTPIQQEIFNNLSPLQFNQLITKVAGSFHMEDTHNLVSGTGFITSGLTAVIFDHLDSGIIKRRLKRIGHNILGTSFMTLIALPILPVGIPLMVMGLICCCANLSPVEEIRRIDYGTNPHLSNESRRFKHILLVFCKELAKFHAEPLDLIKELRSHNNDAVNIFCTPRGMQSGLHGFFNKGRPLQTKSYLQYENTLISLLLYSEALKASLRASANLLSPLPYDIENYISSFLNHSDLFNLFLTVSHKESRQALQNEFGRNDAIIGIKA